jgi:hypothetical protein
VEMTREIFYRMSFERGALLYGQEESEGA